MTSPFASLPTLAAVALLGLTLAAAPAAAQRAGTPIPGRAGFHAGPGVVVVHEIPGITPKVLEFAEMVVPARVRAGDVVVVPSSYGGCDRFGWHPASTAPVRDLYEAGLVQRPRWAGNNIRTRHAVPLAAHLAGVAQAAADIATHCRLPSGLADAVIEFVAGLRAGAGERLPLRHFAEDGGGEVERPARGVAADQGHAVAPREAAKARREAADEGRIVGRQGQRQKREARLGTHRGEVRQVHRQRLPAEVARRRAGREMHALDQGVDAGDPLLAARQREHGRVIADAECDIRARRAAASGQQVDEVELGHPSKGKTRVRGGERVRGARLTGDRCGRA